MAPIHNGSFHSTAEISCPTVSAEDGSADRITPVVTQRDTARRYSCKLEILPNSNP